MLENWKHGSFKSRIPDEVIMDNSSALLLSTVKCFTSCASLNMYLSKCFEALFCNAEPPSCYIRLDRSHIVKQIISMKCLKTEDSRRKRFIQRVLGYLITVDDIKKAQDTIINLFILVHNKYENDEYVLNAKKTLKKLSETHTHSTMNEPEDDDRGVNDFYSAQGDEYGRSKFFEWIRSLVNDVKLNYVNDIHDNSEQGIDSNTDAELIDNIYYAEHLSDALIEFLGILPLWSNVMNPAFKSSNNTPTSSGTEVEFKNIKNLLFREHRGIRVDSFVHTHIEHLRGVFKLALAETKNNMQEHSPEVLTSAKEDEFFEENWKNKNTDVQKSVQTVKRCKFSILNPSTPVCIAIPILKNGWRTIGTKKGDNPSILSEKTSIFDSLFHLYATCFVDMPSHKVLIENDSTEFSKFLKAAFRLHDAKEIFLQRNLLLFNVLKNTGMVSHCKGNLKHINCETSVAVMFQHLCDKFTVLNSMKEWKICNKCSLVSGKVQKKYVCTSQKSLDLANLQISITERSGSRATCFQCKEELQIQRQYNKVVVFDVEKGGHYVDINEISKSVSLSGAQYDLKGVIELRKNNHFVTNVKRNNGCWETYDNLHRKPVDTNKYCKIAMVFYYYKDGLITDLEDVSDSAKDKETEAIFKQVKRFSSSYEKPHHL